MLVNRETNWRGTLDRCERNFFMMHTRSRSTPSGSAVSRSGLAPRPAGEDAGLRDDASPEDWKRYFKKITSERGRQLAEAVS